MLSNFFGGIDHFNKYSVSKIRRMNSTVFIIVTSFFICIIGFKANSLKPYFNNNNNISGWTSFCRCQTLWNNSYADDDLIRFAALSKHMFLVS